MNKIDQAAQKVKNDLDRRLLESEEYKLIQTTDGKVIAKIPVSRQSKDWFKFNEDRKADKFLNYLKELKEKALEKGLTEAQTKELLIEVIERKENE